jgi:hypothetical protein
MSSTIALALVPSNLLSEALKIVENFVVVEMNMNPILSFFKKLGFLDRISRKLGIILINFNMMLKLDL